MLKKSINLKKLTDTQVGEILSDKSLDMELRKKAHKEIQRRSNIWLGRRGNKFSMGGP